MNGTAAPGNVEYTTLASPGSPAEKSGPQTTEFWTLIAHYVLTVFISIMAFLHPGYHLTAGAQGLVDAVVPGFAIIAAAIAHYGYSRSRGQAKAAAAQLAADRVATQTHYQVQVMQTESAAQMAQMQTESSERMMTLQQSTSGHSHTAGK